MKVVEGDDRPRRNMRQVAVRILLVGVTVGGVLFLFVLPGRTWLAQSRAISQAQRQSQLLAQQNAALRERANQLRSPAYIAQIAREQYGLIPPGYQAFGIQPAPVNPAKSATTPGQ